MQTTDRKGLAWLRCVRKHRKTRPASRNTPGEACILPGTENETTLAW